MASTQPHRYYVPMAYDDGGADDDDDVANDNDDGIIILLWRGGQETAAAWRFGSQRKLTSNIYIYC